MERRRGRLKRSLEGEMVIWRGSGLMVVLILLGAMTVSIAAFGWAGIPAEVGAGGLIAAAGVWAFARRIERRAPRVLFDQATGERIVIKADAGALYFIPTRYWAYVFGVVGVLGALNAVIAALTN
jgi:hypothetical protein